jgi:hypothetical protein
VPTADGRLTISAPRAGRSPYFLTVPSSPQWPFVREDGEQCHLKWAANPEAGIKGYRVYHMEGPKINGPGQKVTHTESPWAGGDG